MLPTVRREEGWVPKTEWYGMCGMAGVEAIGDGERCVCMWLVRYTAGGAAENISRGVVMVWKTDPSQVGERNAEIHP